MNLTKKLPSLVIFSLILLSVLTVSWRLIFKNNQNTSQYIQTITNITPTISIKISPTSGVDQPILEDEGEISLTPTRIPFNVTKINLSSDPSDFNGKCSPKGIEILFTAQIETNGPGTVTYKWVRSDGTSSQTAQVLSFDKPGTETVTTSWIVGSPGTSLSGDMVLQIISPETIESEKASFSVICTLGV